MEFGNVPRKTLEQRLLDATKPAIDQARIDKLHAGGVERWGGDWLQANIRAVGAISAAGLRPEEYKLLGTLIAVKICQWGDLILERTLREN